MKILIAAGGTGGHIYPGLALAEGLLKKDSQNEILFVGSKEGMEKEIIPKYNFSVKYPSFKFQMKFISVIRCLRKFTLRSVLSPIFAILAIIQSMLIIDQFKPAVAFLTGGFVSLPVAVAAFVMRVPIVLQEQNVKLGVTNQICSKLAKVVLLSFDESKKYFKSKKGVVVGNPVRQSISVTQKEVARQVLGLAEDKIKVLILGGSQGARVINNVIVQLRQEGIPANVEIIHIIGRRDFDTLAPAKVKNLQKLSKLADFPNYYFVDYLDDIALVLAACDVVVGRAGATALAEMIELKVPAVLIPFPFAAEDHQKQNARVLEKVGAALIIDEKDFNVERLRDLLTLPDLGAKLATLRAGYQGIKKSDPVTKIVDIIYGLKKT